MSSPCEGARTVFRAKRVAWSIEARSPGGERSSLSTIPRGGIGDIELTADFGALWAVARTQLSSFAGAQEGENDESRVKDKADA
jgi:hypothetical protein